MIYLGADHAGFALKEKIRRRLDHHYLDYQDLGTFSEERVDYPEYAQKLAQMVIDHGTLGILFCRSGEGMAMAANRLLGARAAVVWDPVVAKETRAENDANILSLPAGFIGENTAWEIITTFLRTEYQPLERYQRRLKQLDHLPTPKKPRRAKKKS